MSTEDHEANKALVRRYFEEVASGGDLALVDELFAAGYRGHHTGAGEGPAPERIKRRVGAVRAAFPDVVWTIDEQLAEGPRVATRVTARGTHRGDYLGIPPTGRSVAWSTATVHRIAAGQIVESWSSFSVLPILQQLGVIPPTDELVPPPRAGT